MASMLLAETTRTASSRRTCFFPTVCNMIARVCWMVSASKLLWMGCCGSISKAELQPEFAWSVETLVKESFGDPCLPRTVHSQQRYASRKAIQDRTRAVGATWITNLGFQELFRQAANIDNIVFHLGDGICVRSFERDIVDSAHGCYASHLDVYREALAQGLLAAAVFGEFGGRDNAEAIWQFERVLAWANERPDDWDVVHLVVDPTVAVQLASVHEQPPAVVKVENVSLGAHGHVPMELAFGQGATAYLISNRGMNKLVEHDGQAVFGDAPIGDLLVSTLPPCVSSAGTNRHLDVRCDLQSARSRSTKYCGNPCIDLTEALAALHCWDRLGQASRHGRRLMVSMIPHTAYVALPVVPPRWSSTNLIHPGQTFFRAGLYSPQVFKRMERALADTGWSAFELIWMFVMAVAAWVFGVSMPMINALFF